jgi:iron complex outermembrane receptor protein
MSRLAFLHSLLDYQDPNAQLKAIHLSSSIIGQFEMNWQVNEYQLINWGVNHRYDMASSDNFPINTNRNTTAFFLSYRLQLLHKTVHMTSSIREELIDDQFGEPTPSIGMDWLPLQNLKILAKISRNYRTPTFNDLFWQGGYAHGNTDLMAESGWNEELGMEFKKVISIYEASLQLNIFNSHINNLIVWLPENNIWSPVNKKKVWSRGLEIGLQNQFHISQITSMGMNLFFNYNPSELYQGENKGKQLIYSPIMHTKLKYYFNRKIWGFALIYQWYDQRFTTEDNTMYLNPYQLFNLDIRLITPIKKQALSMYFKVNNIFNELYQSVENYATPLRNFQISIHYQF